MLMPVYDAEPFLRDAIESVRRQSWTDFELLIVDDGSRDGSGAIADAHAGADARVRVEHLAHGGLVAALNLGLERIQTELIARADADDVNRPDRLARQIAFLDAHPDVGVCGSWIRLLPAGSVWRLPGRWDALHAMLLFGAPFYHSTVVMRRDWIARGGARYDPAFAHAEDYDFWERAARQTRFANIATALVRYRCHPGQVSEVNRTAQGAASWAIRRRQLLALGITPTAAELQLHEDLVAVRCGLTRARLDAGAAWLERLRGANRATGRYPEPAFTRTLALHWYRNCAEGVSGGEPAAAAAFAASPLAAALPDARRYVARLRLLRALSSGFARGVARLTVRRRARLGRRSRA